RAAPLDHARVAALGAVEDVAVARRDGVETRFGEEHRSTHAPTRSAPGELVAQAREHARVRGREARLGPLLATQRRERAQELLLLRVERRGHLDLDVDVEVAAPRAVQVTHAEVLQRDDLS